MVPEAAQWAAAITRQLPVDHPLGPGRLGGGRARAWVRGRMDPRDHFGEQSLLLAAKAGARRRSGDCSPLSTPTGTRAIRPDGRGLPAASPARPGRNPDPFWRVMGLGYESMALLMLGRSDRARARAEKRACRWHVSSATPNACSGRLYSLGRAWATSDDRLAAAAFDEAIAVTRPVDSRRGRCINLIEWIGAERRLGGSTRRPRDCSNCCSC